MKCAFNGPFIVPWELMKCVLVRRPKSSQLHDEMDVRQNSIICEPCKQSGYHNYYSCWNKNRGD